MAVALADLSLRAGNPVAVPSTMIHVLVVHECPLFRAGLRSFLEQQGDCQLVGEATRLEDVLVLVREHRPDIVLLDGGLTSADPLDMVQQLRRIGVQGIMVFASATADEETLFQFLKYGVTAYEDPFICGEDLIVKMRRMSCGEYLVTGDVLVAQAARRQRLAHIRRDAFLDACLEMDRIQERPCPVSGNASLLSLQERAVLEQIARGGTNAQVAQALGISPHTVKNRLEQLYQKLNVHDRTTAVVMAMREQWIAVEGIHSLSL